eukprot:1855353-Pleurochrysis_carterae.AAC.1
MKTDVGGSRLPESSDERAQASAHAANQWPSPSMMCGVGRRLLSGTSENSTGPASPQLLQRAAAVSADASRP